MAWQTVSCAGHSFFTVWQSNLIPMKLLSYSTFYYNLKFRFELINVRNDKTLWILWVELPFQRVVVGIAPRLCVQ